MLVSFVVVVVIYYYYFPSHELSQHCSLGEEEKEEEADPARVWARNFHQTCRRDKLHPWWDNQSTVETATFGSEYAVLEWQYGRYWGTPGGLVPCHCSRLRAVYPLVEDPLRCKVPDGASPPIAQDYVRCKTPSGATPHRWKDPIGARPPRCRDPTVQELLWCNTP